MPDCVGVLMRKDTSLANIEVTENDDYYIEFISTDVSLYPFDLQKWPGNLGFRRFIEGRITPKTRQGLYEDMKAAGIERYSISAILIASNGRDCSDPFWIRFKDGPQTWKEVWEAIGVYNRK